MSWTTARAQLVSILVSDVTGLSTTRGLPGTLTEDTDGEWDAPLAAGRFRIRCTGSKFLAWSTPGQARHRKVVEIKRGYGGTWKDRSEADAVMWDDEAAVVDALRTNTNWDTSTSCIVALSEGTPSLLDAERDDDAFAITTTITVEHY